MTAEERIARVEHELDRVRDEVGSVWAALAPLRTVPAQLDRIEAGMNETRQTVRQMEIDLAGKRDAAECGPLHDKLTQTTIDRMDARALNEIRQRHSSGGSAAAAAESPDWKYWVKVIGGALATAITAAGAAWFGRGAVG